MTDKFEIYYRPPNTEGHLKLDEALDILFEMVTQMESQLNTIETRIKYLENGWDYDTASSKRIK